MDSVKEYIQTRDLIFDEVGIAPQSKFVNLGNTINNIHYLEIGIGDPLILLHGGGSHSSEWFNILESLSKHYHLFAIDRPGCGLSDFFDYRNVDLKKHAIEFIESLMNALALDKARILGQSMGGYFSLCFAMEHPERVEKLCLIGAPAGMNRWIPLMLRLLGIRGLNNFLLKTAAKPSLANVRNIHKQLLVADISRLPDIYFKHNYYAQMLPHKFKSFTTLLENVLTLRGWNEKYFIGNKLDALRIPTGFIWGTKDAFEKPETGLEKASKIPVHQFEIVNDAGHCPWLDKPMECTSLILSMLSN